MPVVAAASGNASVAIVCDGAAPAARLSPSDVVVVGSEGRRSESRGLIQDLFLVLVAEAAVVVIIVRVVVSAKAAAFLRAGCLFRGAGFLFGQGRRRRRAGRPQAAEVVVVVVAVL